MKKTFLSILFLFFAFCIYAQDSLNLPAPQAPTGLRSQEKIYVVVAVLVTILGGLFVYLIRLDRRISRMEKSDRPLH